MKKRIFILYILVLITIIGFSGCQGDSTSYEDTIVCLGDSLTAGYGSNPTDLLDKSAAYPARLQEKVNVEVINSGTSGITTGVALSQLDLDVKDYNPQIVVIELGANDFFKSIDISTTQQNLQDIISYVSDRNAKIYLAKFYTDTVARDFLENVELLGDEVVTDPAEQTAIIASLDDMFSSLESSNDIELIEDIWSGVWGVYMYDEVHPNADGYTIMAENYFNAMQPYLETNGLVK